MSFWDDLTGDTAAEAARNAAADQYAKQKAATDGLISFGDQYVGKFSDLSKAYDPFIQTGLTANTALARLLADPSSVSSLPGYQFAQEQGVQALDRGAASRGMLNSGRASKDLLRFGTGLADQTYGSQLQRLMGLNQQGMASTGAQVGTAATGLQGQLGTRQSAYGGQMQSAGTIGQGEIAAANAKAAGSQNLLGAGLKLGGMVLGGLGGGFGAPMSLGTMGGTGIPGIGGLY